MSLLKIGKKSVTTKSKGKRRLCFLSPVKSEIDIIKNYQTHNMPELDFRLPSRVVHEKKSLQPSFLIQGRQWKFYWA